MAFTLPDLCLREIFEYILTNNGTSWSKGNPLYSCILVNRIWCLTAIPLLWRDPFFNHPRADNATLLVDVYVSSFPQEELHSLGIRSCDLFSRKPTFNYAEFIQRINITQVHAATCFWLESKSELSTNVSIFQSLCRHLVDFAQNLKYIEFEPGSDSLLDVNMFALPKALDNLHNLEDFICYGEPIDNLYSTVAKVVTKVKNLRISLAHGCPIFSTTLDDLSNLIRSQRRLERISLDNQIGCFCCPHDQSLALDMMNVLNFLDSQASTLSYIYLGSIDFHNVFPFQQLAECKNLRELTITRCRNFGTPNYNKMDSASFARLNSIELVLSAIPHLLAKIFFIQAGKSLRKIKIRQATDGMFTETLKCFAENNPDITYLSASINSEEIFELHKFLNICQKLKHLELWDKNTPEERQCGELHHLMRSVETINVDEILPQIGAALPSSLIDFKTNMRWSFSSSTLGNFINNCQAPLEYLGFAFCECFSEKHMDIIIQMLKRPLKVLHIRHTRIKITPKIRERARHVIRFIDGSSCFI